MSIIIPAVIPTSRRHLDATLELFASFTNEAQVDIVDGVFAPFVSWPYTECSHVEEILSGFRFLNMAVELDLMIKNPEETIDLWAQTGATRIVIHIESTQKIDALLEHAGIHGYKLGLSLNNDTSLEELERIDLSYVDYIQVMGIKDIGSQGQSFDERVLMRISELRARHPQLPISIDGSMNADTVVRAKEAGAARFTVGSAIVKAPSPHAMFTTLEQLAQGHV